MARSPQEKISDLQQDDWKNITDALPDGLMVLDAEANIVAVNPAFSRITGFTAQDLVGRSCSILGCDTCPDPGRGPGCVLSGSGSGETVCCSMTHKSGRKIHLWKRASLLAAADGSVLGAVETLIDDNELRPVNALSNILYQLNDGRRLLVGHSPAMTALLGALDGLATSRAPILIQGESGAGKELVARLLHQLGPRSAQKTVKLNCAALLPEQFRQEPWISGDKPEAEQFQQAPLTSGDQPEIDIILDEISDLPLVSQKQLAGILEQKLVAGLRVIALTNRDLGRFASQGKFANELWQRISIITLTVPPLRERREDLPVLIERLLADLCLRQGRPTARVDRDSLELMLAHPWPGNVRELINALEYALMLAPQGLIQAAHLPPSLTGDLFAANGASEACDERQRLILALKRSGGNQSEAARLLGISRVTVWKRMQRYGIDPKSL